MRRTSRGILLLLDAQGKRLLLQRFQLAGHRAGYSAREIQGDIGNAPGYRTARQVPAGMQRKSVLYGLPATPPDKYITVFRFRFAGEPESVQVTHPAAWLTGNA